MPIGLHCIKQCMDSGPVFYDSGKPKFIISKVRKEGLRKLNMFHPMMCAQATRGWGVGWHADSLPE